MFDLMDYNAFKIEFDNATENGNLDKFMVKHLNVDAVGLPIMSLIEPCESAKKKGYGRGVLYGRRSVKAKWEKILIITL